MLATWIQPFQSAYFFNREGALAPETWQQQEVSLQWAASTPGFKRYWKQWGSMYNEHFKAFLNQMMLEQKGASA